jgi:hypothetical protein
MGQGKSGLKHNGRPRLKLAHAIYLYGTRPMRLKAIIDEFKRYKTLGPSQVLELSRQLRAVHHGLIDDNTAMNLDRRYEIQLQNLLNNLSQMEYLNANESKALIKRLKELRIGLAYDFDDIHTALYR